MGGQRGENGVVPGLQSPLHRRPGHKEPGDAWGLQGPILGLCRAVLTDIDSGCTAVGAGRALRPKGQNPPGWAPHWRRLVSSGFWRLCRARATIVPLRPLKTLTWGTCKLGSRQKGAWAVQQAGRQFPPSSRHFRARAFLNAAAPCAGPIQPGDHAYRKSSHRAPFTGTCPCPAVWALPPAARACG